jgi:mannonate dehydratase
MSIQIGLVLPGLDEAKLRLAKQLGVDGIVAGVPGEPKDGVWEYLPWVAMRKRFEDAGLKWLVSEGIPIPPRVKLGQPGRDEDIEKFLKSLRNMGRAGIPILCYNWMVGLGWARTSFTSRVRGGALATAYNHGEMERGGTTELGIVKEEDLWKTLEYFLKAVVPVAEEENVLLAMHPDDPPLSPIRGIGRIMTNPENFQRLLDLYPSRVNGITFCQGCFSEMGIDVPAAIRHFGKQKKLFFSHFRNVRGPTTDFVELFHDDRSGNADMYEAMKAYMEVGFEGPMRPDHVPAMEGEDSSLHGYTLWGKFMGIGYMRGLMEAIEKNQKA